MGHKEKKAMINTFVRSNFNYGYLISHFSSKKSQNKLGKNSWKESKVFIKRLFKQL